METGKKRDGSPRKNCLRASPSFWCYVMACGEVAGGYFERVLAFSKNSPAQLARRHVWSLPLHRKSPAPRSGPPPPPPPLTPAATPRPREAGHLLVAPARPLRYVSPLPSPRFHPAHATQALPWSSLCLRSAAPLATRLQSPSPPPFPVSTPFCLRAPCRAGNPHYIVPADSAAQTVPDRPRRPVKGYEDQ